MKHLSYCGHPVSASDLDCPCVAISNLGNGGREGEGQLRLGRTHAGHLGGDNKKVMTPPNQSITISAFFLLSSGRNGRKLGGGGVGFDKRGK